MNQKIRFDQSIYLILYAKYKAYLLPLGVICASIFVFLVLILPQFQTYFNNRDEVAADQHTIQTLNQNIQTLTLLNESEIKDSLTIANAALPSEKDFTGILNAISHAASLANVSLGDYSFQIGNLFGKTTSAGTGQLSLTVSLSINGDLTSAQQFINLLGKEFPLSEVTGVNFRGNSGSDISATFFYNPLSDILFNASLPIGELSPAQQKLMTSLSKDFEKPADIAIPKKPEVAQ